MYCTRPGRISIRISTSETLSNGTSEKGDVPLLDGLLSPRRGVFLCVFFGLALIGVVTFWPMERKGNDSTNIGREYFETIMHMMYIGVREYVPVFHMSPYYSFSFAIYNGLHFISGESPRWLHKFSALGSRRGGERMSRDILRPRMQKVEVFRYVGGEKLNIYPTGSQDSLRFLRNFSKLA